MRDENKGLIILPYAYGGVTGASIQNVDRQKETYLKNICTAALSAKHNAGVNTEVMVVSNIDIPSPYGELLTDKGVAVEKCEFDRFNFGSSAKDGTPVRWQLAFYKLCALAHCIEKFDYMAFCFLDADVYVQQNFDRIWTDAQNNILLYDLNATIDGYMVKEMKEFLKNERFLTHYGGEFFAASKSLASKFLDEAEKVYDKMLAEEYMTRSGDEFITSIAADNLREYIKNGGSYIRRYWTGSYRVVCNDYDKGNIVILHVPAEKEQGIVRIYNKYISKDIIPGNKVVWKHLHLRKQSLRVSIGKTLRRLGILK
ncbi:MAG: hypothetical protein K2N03_05205 [Muribaculaceae bacterium]|nr:hypothetical protein [Muribaculaceae bacterium]